MNKPTADYWYKRFALLTESLLSKGEQYNQNLLKEYEKAILNIQRDIEIFYQKFADNNEISLVDAKKLLNARELQEFQWAVEEYIQKGRENAIDQRWMQELENASTRIRISRLESLQLQIRQQIEIITAKRLLRMTKLAAGIIEKNYYNSIYEIQKGLGVGDAFNVLDVRIIESIIAKPWAPDGSNFSERIWKDRELLVNELQKELAQSFIRGDAPDEAIRNIAKTMETSKKAAGRLVMTESAFFANEARARAFKELGVEEYQFLATLDMKTSIICQEMDLKIFKLSDREIGVNWPPLHPWCRSTVVPYFGSNKARRFARDPKTGKGYYVPGDISYEEWHKKYVVNKYGKDKMEIMEKKVKNKASDREQYEKYKDILEKDAPRSFDKFQDLKYNNSEDWKFIKLDYSRRNKLINNPELKLPKIDTATIDDRKFTEYLFAGKNKDGLIKGKLITDKLGYSIDNYKDFKKEILERGALYPAKLKSEINQGHRYETRTFFYSKDKSPVNVEIGWLVNKDKTHMTSVYINEVKNNED